MGHLATLTATFLILATMLEAAPLPMEYLPGLQHLDSEDFQGSPPQYRGVDHHYPLAQYRQGELHVHLPVRGHNPEHHNMPPGMGRRPPPNRMPPQAPQAPPSFGQYVFQY